MHTLFSGVHGLTFFNDFPLDGEFDITVFYFPDVKAKTKIKKGVKKIGSALINKKVTQN